jgi:FkbM family methyltransferase
MSFVSYAQNFEDVMLWRALKHVEDGFYIDVGANDPHTDSVTKAFYERNWHGINIEPLAEHHEALTKARARDLNIQCAIGDCNGSIELWETDVRGWATASPEVIQAHALSGHLGTFHQVPMRTLASICAEYVKSEIHFLKVDVEGFEASVLRGADFEQYRPWIVVVESTQPNSTVEVHSEWESILLEKRYAFVYGDGLNRFYLADEHCELGPTFRYPPNPFDRFTTVALEESIAAANRAQANMKAAEAKSLQIQSELESLYNSRSWKITSPLRWMKLQLGRLRNQGLRKRLRALKAKLRHRVIAELQARPQFRLTLSSLARKLGLYALLRRIYRQIVIGRLPSKPNFSDLSPWAQRVRERIRAEQDAIKNGNK